MRFHIFLPVSFQSYLCVSIKIHSERNPVSIPVDLVLVTTLILFAFKYLFVFVILYNIKIVLTEKRKQSTTIFKYGLFIF